MVYTRRPPGKRSRTILRLTILKPEEDLNLANPRLVTKLGATLYQNAEHVHFQGCKMWTQGYILLNWALEPSTEPYYQTRFEVVEQEDFPFDVTLCESSAAEYGFRL